MSKIQPALALARRYTEDTAQGMGALKGAPAQVKSIALTETGAEVTFSWTGTNGTEQTAVMPVKDAYGIAVANGFSGTQAEWLESLKGKDGEQGQEGKEGKEGPPGENAVAAINPRGDYDSGAEYGKSDYITYTDGNAYVYKADTPSAGNAPTTGLHDDPYWQLLALRGAPGKDGVTFTPSLSDDGVLNWTNDGGRENPAPQNIKGVTPNVQVGTVTTLEPGEAATVTRREGSPDSAPVFDFGIPTGAAGATVAQGVSFDNSVTGMEAENVQAAIDTLFTSASDGKAAVAAAITGKGVETAADATFQTMAGNIEQITTGPDTSDATAAAEDILSGKTAYVNGSKVTGSMSNRGAVSPTALNAGESYTIPKGYHNGSGIVNTNSLADQTEATSIAADIRQGKTAYVDGTMLTGTMVLEPVEDIPRWAEATLPSTSTWRPIACGDGVYVVIAANSAEAAYSTDCITWTPVTLPRAAPWFSVVYGNGRFVITTSSGNTCAYSTDGITWTASTMPTSGSWYGLTYGDGKFVAVRRSSAVAAYSTDGKNWTSTTLPSTTTWEQVAYGMGKFVALGWSSGVAAYSTDGVTWTATTMPGSLAWSSVAGSDEVFVAVARNTTKVAYSTNGISWSTSTMPSSAAWWCVAHGNGKFVIIASSGSDKAAYSTDGITWTAGTLPSAGSWRGLTYGDGKFAFTEGNTDHLIYTDTLYRKKTA